MKYMLLALMPLCLASCSEEENVIPDKSYQEVRVTAGAGTDSRIVLNDEGDRITTFWQDGDKIFLFTSTQTGLEYSTDLDKNAAMAEFTPVDEALEAIEGNTVYACYPGFSSVESGTAVGLIPTGVIDYNNGTIPSFGYAVGTISEGGVEFKFKHTAAFLLLKVTPKMLTDATKGISTITVTTTSDVPLSVGEGDSFDFSTLTANTTNGSNTVQVNVDNQIVESDWTAYVPILPQPADADITITLADSEGNELYTTVKKAPETGFLAGYVYRHVPDMAYLIDGPTFNSRIKDLAKADYNGENKSIGKIEFVTEVKTLPEEYIVVSADDSPAPVYASFNNVDSLLTVFTPAKDINIINASEIFSGLRSLHSVDFGNFDINETTTSASKMFYYCSALTSLDVSGWDVSNVTDMSYLFYYCPALTSLDVSGWDTGNVTNMSYLFYYCESLTSLAVSGWDVSNVADMREMFDFCYSLTSLDVSGWDTGNVANMWCLFRSCESLTSLDVSSWDTSNVTDMAGIFINCSSLSSLDVSGWDTGNVINMNGVFSGCSSLQTLNLSNWNTSNVTNMSSMFSGCSLSSLDISGWNTSNVTDMNSMFLDCSLSSLDISDWDTGNVMNMSSMFSGCSLSSLDVSDWNTEHVRYMNSVFADCTDLTSLDVSGWDTGNVINMEAVFSGCSSLQSLNLSSWDTGNVMEMVTVFSDCSSLSSLDVSGWDTGNVTKMSGVFYGCSSLQSLNLSGWNTENVIDVSSLFCKCSSLTSLNMTHWNLRDDVSVSYMFIDCAFTSQACEIITSTEIKEFLLGKTETTGMISDWFTWKNEGVSYGDMNNRYW